MKESVEDFFIITGLFSLCYFFLMIIFSICLVVFNISLIFTMVVGLLFGIGIIALTMFSNILLVKK